MSNSPLWKCCSIRSSMRWISEPRWRMRERTTTNWNNGNKSSIFITYSIPRCKRIHLLISWNVHWITANFSLGENVVLSWCKQSTASEKQDFIYCVMQFEYKTFFANWYPKSGSQLFLQRRIWNPPPRNSSTTNPIAYSISVDDPNRGHLVSHYAMCTM